MASGVFPQSGTSGNNDQARSGRGLFSAENAFSMRGYK